MTNNEKIAEIREAHEVIKRNGLNLDYEAIDFLLSELQSTQQEIEQVKAILRNGDRAHWQIFKIRQLTGVKEQ